MILGEWQTIRDRSTRELLDIIERRSVDDTGWAIRWRREELDVPYRAHAALVYVPDPGCLAGKPTVEPLHKIDPATYDARIMSDEIEAIQCPDGVIILDCCGGMTECGSIALAYIPNEKSE